MSTISKEVVKLGMYANPSLMEWLAAHIYLGHRETLAAIMTTIETLCKNGRLNVAFISVTVETQYDATVHHRGLMIMTIATKDQFPAVIGRIALLTAIPSSGMTENIIGHRLIQRARHIDTEKLRGIGVDPIAEGGGMDWDEFRMWLTLNGTGTIGERLRRMIEEHLISRNLTNLPLRFCQGNYRRKARYVQCGQIKVDVVLPPDGDRLATIKLHTESTEGSAGTEYLETVDFQFEFNPEAFTKPEEARNMQVQQTAAPEAANMVQMGKGLDYLPMWAPIDLVRPYMAFVEWLKANAPEAIIDDMDQYLTELDLESKFDGFRFKDVNHPKLEGLLSELDKPHHGDITFECLKDGNYNNDDLIFIITAQKKENDSGWYESIVGWPGGQSNVKKPTPPVDDKIRMSLFATNGNMRDTGLVRKLQVPQGTMSQDQFITWFNANATSAQGFHTLDKLQKLILDSPAVRGRNPELERRFFINVPLHATLAPVVVGAGDPNISGYLDVAVVEAVAGRPGEFRQTGLFNFTTRALIPPGSTQVGEFIDTYIHPDSRGCVSVGFDTDQVYTFGQLSDLFKSFDKDGAQNLVQYQSSVRNILRRLYGKEAGPHLYLRLSRSAHPILRGVGTMEPGKITAKVFDTYLGVNIDTPLVTFDLVTGLTSDMFVNRNVEIIQGVECQAEEELKKRQDAAREQARVQTLAAIGSPIEVLITDTPSVTEDGMKKVAKSITSMQTGSFEFFHNVVMGVLPMVSAELADRIHGFLEHLVHTYGKTMSPAEYDFKFDDGVELTIDVREANGNRLHFGIKL